MGARDATELMPRSVLTHCPSCGGGQLIPVATIEGRNFFCRDCVGCWHLESGEARLVDPQACPGCQLGMTACFERWTVLGLA
jgi:hypothetical protein